MRHILAFLKEAEKMRFSVAIFSMKVSDNLPSVCRNHNWFKNPHNLKNEIHHDKEHEETKTMVVFIFSIDNQKVV